MSTATEDDIELKDMVTQLLDSSGVLGKLKAQLRAHVYTALESGQVNTKSDLTNPSLKEFLSSTTGRLMICLVREFLEFFQLDFTLAVFDPETNVGKDLRYRGRSKLIDSLGLTELVDQKAPLLSEIMRLSKVSVLKSESPTPTEISEEDNTSNLQQSLAQDQSRSSDRLGYRDFKDCVPVDDDDSLTPDLSLHLDQGHTVSLPQPDHRSRSAVTLDLRPETLNAEKDRNDGQGVTEVPEQDSELEEKESSVGAGAGAGGHDATFQVENSQLKDGTESSKKQDEELGLSFQLEKSRASSLLGALPPLGSSSNPGLRGELPPLVGGRGELPPLGKPADLPPLSGLPKSLQQETTKDSRSQQIATNSLLNTKARDETNLTSGTKVGEEKDSMGEYSVSEDMPVSEDIAEDLDSFSSQSNAEQFTKEEGVQNSDTSLRADHVESL